LFDLAHALPINQNCHKIKPVFSWLFTEIQWLIEKNLIKFGNE
jgi:hypothetical protein